MILIVWEKKVCGDFYQKIALEVRNFPIVSGAPLSTMEYSALHLLEVVEANTLVIFSNNFKRSLLPVPFLCCCREGEGQK